MQGMEGMKMDAPTKAGPMEKKVGDLTFTLSTQPEKTKAGENTLRLKITDKSGKPVTDAQVSFQYTMEMPGMVLSKAEAKLLERWLLRDQSEFRHGGPMGRDSHRPAARSERNSREVQDCTLLSNRGKRNDRKNHRGKREEQIHCFSHGCFPQRLGNLGVEEHSPGCDTGSLRRSGDRLHALDGEKSDHHRRSGDLSDRDNDGFCAEGQVRARLFRLRVFLRLHHF